MKARLEIPKDWKESEKNFVITNNILSKAYDDNYDQEGDFPNHGRWGENVNGIHAERLIAFVNRFMLLHPHWKQCYMLITVFFKRKIDNFTEKGNDQALLYTS